jgi:hypothetical protein
MGFLNRCSDYEYTNLVEWLDKGYGDIPKELRTKLLDTMKDKVETGKKYENLKKEFTELKENIAFRIKCITEHLNLLKPVEIKPYPGINLIEE